MRSIIKNSLIWGFILSIATISKCDSKIYWANVAESLEIKPLGTKEVTVVSLPARQKPASGNAVLFKIYKGMNYTPAPPQKGNYPGWERIAVNGSFYWIPAGSGSDSTIKDSPYDLPYKLHIDKTARKLRLMKNTLSGWKVVRKYRIALGKKSDIRPKKREGDCRTPTGAYYICKINPASAYGEDPVTGEPLASLMISYPNQFDAWDALQNGRIDIKTYNSVCEAIGAGKIPPQDTPLGSYLMIHGGGSDEDWTLGCIALDDKDMKDLLKYAKTGMIVEIKE